MLQQNVFRGFDLRIDRSRLQKRLVLGPEDRPLPFMAWSAGQREFVPLLLGFYWLMPPSKAKTRDTIEWVVLEELEMGLHPRAIEVLLLMTMELVSRGYRVCLSSHSPQVLEALWAPAFDCLPGISSGAAERVRAVGSTPRWPESWPTPGEAPSHDVSQRRPRDS